MIEELNKGTHPINVTLQKWIDISSVPSIYRLSVRHQFDEGQNNCALCYVYKECKKCIFYLYYHVRCDESIDEKDKKYKKDFYAQYRDTGNPKIVIDALNKIKKRMKWILFKFFIKSLFVRFILFIKRCIKKILIIFKKERKEYVISTV